MSKPLGDLKEALSSGRKPDVTHLRRSLAVYLGRACEYGDDKYERANYARPTGSTAEDFARLRAYLGAALRHLLAWLDSLEHHQAGDPFLEDEAGMRAAAYAPDTDDSPKFPASQLPHGAHLAASIMMAIEQATAAGLIPVDPGRPWDAAVQRRQKLRQFMAGETELDRAVDQAFDDEMRRAMTASGERWVITEVDEDPGTWSVTDIFAAPGGEVVGLWKTQENAEKHKRELMESSK